MRWVLALAAAIYLSMYFVGRDHGQVRQGLVGVKPVPAVAEAVAVVPAAVAPAMAPVVADMAAQPVPAAKPRSGAEDVPAAASALTAAIATLAPEALLKPGESLGQALVVTARGAVVREGPGIQYRLVGRLAQGSAVQEVVQPIRLVGWSVVQFTDANGARKQGYVVTRLLGQK